VIVIHIDSLVELLYYVSTAPDLMFTDLAENDIVGFGFYGLADYRNEVRLVWLNPGSRQLAHFYGGDDHSK
jgi:hypothetical protein